MKNLTPAASRICPRIITLLVAAVCVPLLAPIARAQANEIDIGVRPKVVDKEWKVFGRLKPIKHGKLYGILAVLLIPSESKLVKPVDANRLMELTEQVLNAQGFHRAVAGQRPEILITLAYGRGWLRNPYTQGAGEEQSGQSIGTTGGAQWTGVANEQQPIQSVGGNDAPTVTVTGMGEQRIKEKTTGYEAKLQKAEYEKLYVRVMAWDYPTGPKAKQLWNSTILVDDPDHRDLNDVAAEMLAAGAPYFDKDSKVEEIDVYRPVPDGRVSVGTPEVVKTDSRKAK